MVGCYYYPFMRRRRVMHYPNWIFNCRGGGGGRGMGGVLVLPSCRVTGRDLRTSAGWNGAICSGEEEEGAGGGEVGRIQPFLGRGRFTQAGYINAGMEGGGGVEGMYS